jgi:hypothetical protein
MMQHLILDRDFHYDSTMQRRRLLQLGLGAAAVVALAGGGIALMRPGWIDGRLTAHGRELFSAVATAVLDGSLPAAGPARDAALQAHLQRLDGTIAAFPSFTQSEIAQLIALLASTPGRVVLAGLHTPWADASVAEIQAALQGMRISSLALRQQAYHALRDLTNAAFFSDPSTWALLGYPGPTDL